MSSERLSEVLQQRRADNNCQLGATELNTIVNCKTVAKPARAQVDWAVDYAVEQGVAVRQFPNGNPARGWYCKAVYKLGINQFLEFVSIAKADGEAGGAKLFSTLISDALGGRK